LKIANIKVVVFFVNFRDTEFPDSIRKEFDSSLVSIEIVDHDFKENYFKQKLYNIFKTITQYFVFSKSTWSYGQIGNKEKLKRLKVWAYLERALFSVCSRFHFLKTFARFVEQEFFYSPVYSQYFEKYNPDAVFSTSIIASHDIQFLKEAKKRKISTISMPKGWDNITKLLYRVVPDYLIVQNEIMKEQAKEIQKISSEKIFVTGFPQFDWYRKNEIILSRSEFFQKLGLPEDRKLIFFGSEGAWAPDETRVVEVLAEAVQTKGGFDMPASLLIRPHYSDVRNPRFKNFEGLPFVKVDDNYNLSNFFIDNWNPTVEETKFFVNCIYHCDVMVMTASTLALDAMAFDKPTLGLAYNILFDPRTGEDISRKWYETDHMLAVLETNAIDVVFSDNDLIAKINQSFTDPKRKEEERQKLIENICYKIDGKSSQRVADVIFRALGKE
jgi:hypothetical protein